MCTPMFRRLKVLKDIDLRIKGSDVLFMISYIDPDNPALAALDFSLLYTYDDEKELCSMFCIYFVSRYKQTNKQINKQTDK